MRDQLELAMEALEEENKQLREKVKLLEEVCDIAQADVKTLDKMNDRLHGELEDLHQALHDARIENSGQAAELERLREAKRWIPVDEAHPPANEMVLVCIGSANRVMMCSIDMSGVWAGYQPTHWMPLPEGPTEGQP
jgi:hypothetical protein